MPDPKKQSPIQVIGGIVGAVVGLVVGRYTALNLVIPTALALLVGWIGSRTFGARSKPFLVAFALQAGHALWMLLGAVLLNTYSPVALDLMIYAIGLLWLLLQPGIGPVVLLTLYQAVGIALNASQLAAAEVGSNPHKALVVHLIFRAVAVVMMLLPLYQERRRAKVRVPELTGQLASEEDHDPDPWRAPRHG
jgi:hypothetical protein